LRAKEYLQQLKKINIIIKQLEREKYELAKKFTDISSLDLISRDDITNRLAALSVEIDRFIAEYAEKKHSILITLSNLSRPEYIQLLALHYVDGHKFGSIAKEMHYTYDHIIRLHKQALSELEKRLNYESAMPSRGRAEMAVLCQKSKIKKEVTSAHADFFHSV